MLLTSKIKSVVKQYLPKNNTTDFIQLYWLNRKAKKGLDGSYADERATLENLIKRLGINSGFVVDVAASDGFSQSCTLGLFGKENWSGLAVEMDPDKFFKLSYIYSSFPNAKLARNRVTPNNIVDLLKAFEVPKDFEVLNLDIDSYDLHVIKSMLLGGFKPKVITMEINEKIPTGVYFTVDFDENHYWQVDHFYGCSIDAASEVVKEFGYILWKVDYNNAFFINIEVTSEDFEDQSPEQAYINGYKNRTDRETRFPWNADVDHWLNLPTTEVIREITEYFKKYNGKFTVRQSSIVSKPTPPQP